MNHILLILQRIIHNSIASVWLILIVFAIRFIINRFFKDKVARWVMPVLWGIVGIRFLIPIQIEALFWNRLDEYLKYRGSYPGGRYQGLIELDNNGFGLANLGFIELDSKVYNSDLYKRITTDIISYRWLRNFLIVWLIGVTVMTLYFIYCYVRLKKEITESAPTGWGNVRMCDRVKQPFIIGVFDPIVYMPSIVSKKEFNYIVEHEHAHIERRDNIRKFIGYVILIIHWFNPLVWIAYLLYCKDIELACDERAVSYYSGKEKKTYANMLLDWSMGTPAALAIPLAFGEIGVKQRVEALVSGKKKKGMTIALSIGICIFVAGCFCVNPCNGQTLIWTGINRAGETESQIYTKEELDEAAREYIRTSMANDGDYTMVITYAGDESVKNDWYSQNTKEAFKNGNFIILENEIFRGVSWEGFDDDAGPIVRYDIAIRRVCEEWKCLGDLRGWG